MKDKQALTQKQNRTERSDSSEYDQLSAIKLPRVQIKLES